MKTSTEFRTNQLYKFTGHNINTFFVLEPIPAHDYNKHLNIYEILFFEWYEENFIGEFLHSDSGRATIDGDILKIEIMHFGTVMTGEFPIANIEESTEPYSMPY